MPAAIVWLALGVSSCGEQSASELPQLGVSTQALTQTLRLPFPPGHTWYVCQSYVGFSHQSNRAFDIGWTQVSCNGGNNDSGGRPIVTPASGTVSHMPNTLAGGDFMCVSLTGGGAIVLGHVLPDSGIVLGSQVTAGQQVATVRTSTDPQAQNAGIAHLHFEGWSGNGCYSGTAEAFTGAWQMQCAPDLPYNAQYGYYIGTPLTPCPATATEHDVNGDGRADLVSVHDDGNAWVWPGQADGTFGAAVSSLGGSLDSANFDGVGQYIVGVADVTGDGKSDLVGVDNEGFAHVWPGQSTGELGAAVSSFGGTYDYANWDGSGHQIAGVADVTGDGRADLVSANDDGSVYVYPGEASGAFGGGVASFDGTFDGANHDGTGHYVVGVADVTGDGNADLVSVHDDGNAYVYPGQSSGAFAGYVASFGGTWNYANWDGTGHYVVDVADVTGDGMADLVTVDADGNGDVYPGQSSGNFGDPVTSFGGTMDFANRDGTGHWVAGVGDITGDGSGDLVAMGDDGNAYVWQGGPSGTFGSAISSFAGTMDFANLDGTGHYIVAPSGPDGKSSTTGSSTSSGQASVAAAGTSGTGMDPQTANEESRGCACRAGARTRSSPPTMWIVAALTMMAAGRRRSGRLPHNAGGGGSRSCSCGCARGAGDGSARADEGAALGGGGEVCAGVGAPPSGGAAVGGRGSRSTRSKVTSPAATSTLSRFARSAP